MRTLVAAPFIPISKFPHSHRGAQGIIYADMLRQAGKDVTCYMSLDLYHSDFNKFDELYVYHGSDWSGHLNVYGGLHNFPYAYNFRNFSHFRGRVYSLGIPFPDYHGLVGHKMDLYRQKGKVMQPEWEESDWDNVLRMQREAEVVVHPHPTKKLVIGDSHAICMYRPGWTVNSVPYKTLHGALEMGLDGFLPECYQSWSDVEEVEFYFGNIDIRHHLCRQEEPRSSTLDLARDYLYQVEDLVTRYDLLHARIYELLPIENESRPIPKTGYYDNSPFHGSWEERDLVRRIFNSSIEHRIRTEGSGVEFVSWTNKLLNDAGELDFKHMERPKSVHLSRAAYPWWQGRDWTGGATLEHD